MARTTPPEPVEERIQDIPLATEMQDSFLEYAYSVIYSRALPDARDGLKPVQRRILFRMSEMGLQPPKGHVKCALVVGDVMGRLHPHGDTAIYDALVRMAQPWAMRVPLVDGHGNFGSLDDGPAAYRYTEARLATAALAMTQDLDEDVVDFVPNYDGQLTQPSVLPAAYPNLLVNGATGIAVGMATNMAPHNLNEVVAAAIHLIENPAATVDELMAFVPGPDFPGGGTLLGIDGVKEAYATGKGGFKVRGKVSVESLGPRKTGLVVTELPYMVGPERLIEKIRDAVQSKKLQGVSDVVDLSDRKNGLRVVITVKTGFDPQAVLEQLYRLTPLEDSFSINNVALVGGQPRTLGLKELLEVYIEHRVSVVTRRSQYRLNQALDRLHIVEGLLLALVDIDEVIQVIRTSDDVETARTRLMSVFDLSEVQANHILELRLRRLTKLSRLEVEKQQQELLAEIEALRALLENAGNVRRQVAVELDAVAEQLGTPRRTVLTSGAIPTPRRAAGPVDTQIADGPTTVLLSSSGRLIRIDSEETIATPPRRSKHDAVRSSVPATVRGHLWALTSKGRAVRFTPIDVPAVPAASVQFAAGIKVSDYLGTLEKGETVLALSAPGSETPIALGTRQGVVKRYVPATLPDREEAAIISLKPGDAVVGAAPANDDDDVVFVTSDAQLLHFSASAVRPQGAAAGGMAGIKLGKDAEVIAFQVVQPENPEPIVVTISGSDTALPGLENGRVKVSALADFPAKGRATGGVRAHALRAGENRLLTAWAGVAPARAITSTGAAVTLPEQLAKRDASGVELESAVASIGSAIGAS